MMRFLSEKELIADKVFAARAQENTAYYTDRKAYLLDADAVEKLAEKHIRIRQARRS